MDAPDYGNMTHAQLVQLRNSLPPNDPKQPALAAYEHQAFAREWTQEDPVLAPLSLAFAIPAYAAAKGLGIIHARTPASLGAVVGGYKGIGQGLFAALAQHTPTLPLTTFGTGS